MKRSHLFLTLALTTPVVLTLVGLAASGTLQSVRAGASESAAADPLTSLDWLTRADANAQVVIDETVDVGDSLAVKADAARLSIAFDPSLAGKARVKVSAKRAADVEAALRPDRFSFGPKEEVRDGISVDLVLPAKWRALSIQANASRCELAPKLPIAVDALKVELNAGNCDLDFAALSGQSAEFIVNAGSMEVVAAQITYQNITTLVNAGRLTWSAKAIAFPARAALAASPAGQGGGEAPKLSFTNAVGTSEIDIDGMPEHALLAKTNMGNLTLKRGGITESLSGMDESRSIDAPAGSPQVTLNVSMGNMDVDLD